MAKWLVHHTAEQQVSSSSPAAKACLWGKQPTAMLAIYTGEGVSPEVNLRECISRTLPPNANKAAHTGFEPQRRCHQKSKTEISVTPKWTGDQFFLKTNMHSSRTCTTHFSGHLGGGDSLGVWSCDQWCMLGYTPRRETLAFCNLVWRR